MAKSNGFDFKKLIESSQNQLVPLLDAEFMLNRNVDQISQESKKLQSKAASVAGDVAKNKAHHLLAVKGFDAEKLGRTLNAIELKAAYEPVEPLSETDLDGYLRHEHDMTILTAIEEVKKEGIKRFDENFADEIEKEWEETKRELLESEFRARKQRKTSAPSTPSTPMRQQTLFPTLPITPRTPRDAAEGPGIVSRSTMDNKMMKYAPVIYALNEHKKQNKPFGLVSVLKEVASTIDDRDMRKPEVIDCWELLRCMLHEENTVKGEFQSRFLSQACYLRDYLSEDKDLKRSIIYGAKKFFENQYVTYMQAKIASNPSRAAAGPLPTFQNRVRAFLNVIYDPNSWPTNLEIIDGSPIWAQIYYCLRCGELEAALNVAKSCHSFGESRLGNFTSFLSEYVQNYHTTGRISEKSRAELAHEYKQLINNRTCDPFRLVVYNVIGKCDPNKFIPEVSKTTQDFLWLKLSLVKESESQDLHQFQPHEYSLDKLQALLIQYGPSHFNPTGRKPLLYFQVLEASQQFEKAVQYLNTYEQYVVEAVHFAIGMYYYGILRLPTHKGSPTFDFVRMLTQYVEIFSLTNPIDALQYLLIIREDEVDQQNVSLRDKAIKDLLLETREFEILLPKIEELLGREKALHITDMAASESDIQGRYEDAVKLYDLAENYDQVLSILNNQLSRVITAKSLEKERLKTLATSVYHKHAQLHILDKVVNRNLLITFEKLTLLLRFFEMYNQQQYDDALQFMEALDIIPFNVERVQFKVDAFKLLDQTIKAIFPEVLLATMDILYRVYSSLKSGTPTLPALADGGRELKMQEFRHKARALVMFAGLIPFRMPGDTNARLIRMEVFMS